MPITPTNINIIQQNLIKNSDNNTQCTENYSQINTLSGINYEYYGETDNQGQKEGYGIQNWKDN